ncbi:hypothetical protein [Yoonia sp. BS5-3]|uniref:Cation/multidrug efflux pump n=1 Tax=Yoonia phaeophyticola TaxID=3137369 RepID=A0ABZ2V7D6_9RHOB
MAFVRLFVFGFIILTILYFCISLYSRSVRTERLENEFDEAHPNGAPDGARDAFVQEGLKAYDSSIRPKLIGLVYVVPVIAISVIVYVINAY